MSEAQNVDSPPASVPPATAEPVPPQSQQARRSPVDVAQDKLAKALSKLPTCNARVRAAEEGLKHGTEKTEFKRKEIHRKALVAQEALQNDISSLKISLLAKQQAALHKIQEEAAEAARRESAAAEARSLCAAALISLVTIRLSLQSKMDNNTDKNENVWLHVHMKYEAEITDGKLAPANRRSLESLKTAFSKQQAAYKQHCEKKKRMAASGAPAEQVSECTEFLTVTTATFNKFKWDERPAIQAIHSINGGNAEEGGQDALHVKRGKRTAAATAADDDDDDDDNDGGGSYDGYNGNAVEGGEGDGEGEGGAGTHSEPAPTPAASAGSGKQPKGFNLGGGSGGAKWRGRAKGGKAGEGSASGSASLLTHLKRVEKRERCRERKDRKRAKKQRAADAARDMNMLLVLSGKDPLPLPLESSSESSKSSEEGSVNEGE